jgi:hypothetical protein
MPPTWSVPLPEGAEGPFTVYLDGAPRHEGTDFTVEGRWLRFTEPLTSRKKVGRGGKLLLGIGIGVYKDLKSPPVDLQYFIDGRPQLANNLPVIPPTEE